MALRGWILMRIILVRQVHGFCLQATDLTYPENFHQHTLTIQAEPFKAALRARPIDQACAATAAAMKKSFSLMRASTSHLESRICLVLRCSLE